MEAITKIAIFKKKQVRKTIFQNEWWFSVVDVVEILTDSERSSIYWTAMKVRVKSDDEFELFTEIYRQEESHGVPKLKSDANRGGKIAGVARKELEKN